MEFAMIATGAASRSIPQSRTASVLAEDFALTNPTRKASSNTPTAVCG